MEKFTLRCPHCGRDILSLSVDSELKRPPPSNHDGMKIEGLGLSARAMNGLLCERTGLTRSSPATALLEVPKVGWLKNIGKVTFGELIAALQVDLNCTMEQIERSVLWQMAPEPFRDFILTPGFERNKRQYVEWRQRTPAV